MQHNFQRVLNILVVIAVVLGLTGALSASNLGYADLASQTAANINAGAGSRAVDAETGALTADVLTVSAKTATVKPIDQPNPLDKARLMERQRMLEAGQTAEAASLAQTGTDRVLVVLVEFAGTDVFTWTAPITPSIPSTGSTWDPLGIADPNEYTGVVGDCSKIITQTKTFTYTGPLHNQIEKPRSAADRSGDSIWTPDFNKQWFTDFMFGNGVNISYTRQDNTTIFESFTGQSVNQYFGDLSNHTYTVTGDVVGWLSVPHSTWYYDADQCPGARSGVSTSRGVIPGAGNARTLVVDAVKQVNAISNTIPGFSWANYDTNGDGIIDRLWIVHAGYGEEDGTGLLNRAPVVQGTFVTPAPASFYGEAAVWSHSSSVTPPYSVTQSIAAGAYIAMPENGGIGVFAHEYAHNLGADDLYAYGEGETSTGFWALQADDWTGYPIGFEPPAPDPWHLDNWGWLSPKVITDASQVYTVTLGQASYFNTNTATGPVYRGLKIPLPAGAAPLPAPVWQGSNYWWGGKADVANGSMKTAQPITLSAGSSYTLTFDIAYGIETEWDFLWVQASTNGGTTWNTLSNTHTICTHDSSWIGGEYGMDGKCGLTDYNASFPDPDAETFNLSAYAGQSVVLRFWYMTDWGTTYEGPFIDNVAVRSNSGVIFSDNAEAGDAKWAYVAPWVRSNGTQSFTHNYYAQWRNTNANGGYDSSLGDSRWRYGPANTGLLMWYNNNFYSDNEIYNYLQDFPSFGPKGRMLVIDSNPDPYRDPNNLFPNSIANLLSRSQMRDAPFTLQPTVGFTFTAANGIVTDTRFAGRPAVSTFNDARGYYPGLEYALRGPSPCANKYWFDKMWDASAVVPARTLYSTKATGAAYAGEGIRMRGAASPTGVCGSAWYGYWYPPFVDATNSGNPGDVNGQYGWHVQVVQEAPDHTWATVRVWNTSVDFTSAVDKAAITVPGVYTVTYQTVVKNEIGSSVVPVVAVTYTLDTNLTLVGMTQIKNGTVVLPSTPTTHWSATNMWPGDMVTLTVVATGTASTPVVVSTKVDAFDGDARGPWNLYTPIQVGPDLRVTKTGPASAKQGDVITYTLTFSNAGNMSALNVWVTDTLPAGVVALPGAVTSMFIPVVPVTSTAIVYSLPVTVTTQGVTLTNRVAITSITPQLTTVGKSATWSTVVAKTNYIYLPIIRR